MKPANSDATGTIRATLNTQSGNHHDARQDPDAGRSQSTQQPAPTVSVDNDRQTIALPAQFPPPQQELTNQFVPGAPPGQLSASQPVLRGLASTESVHGSGIGQTHVPGSLALQALGLTSCEQAVMITGGSSLEQGGDPGMVQAALDKNYRSELSAWVESAAPAGRAAHQEAQKRINSHLINPAKRKKSLNLSDLDLTNLPPLPSDLEALYLSGNKLTALPKHLPQDLRVLDVKGNKLTALPEHLPQGLLELHVAETGLSALPKNLPQSLQELDVSCNKLSALPEYLPQGLRKLDVGSNKLTALPKNLPQNLEYLSVKHNGFDSKTLVAFMRSNTSIKNQIIHSNDIDDDSMEVLFAEQINNIEHPARLEKAAVTLDLLTRFGLATSDQSGALIKRTSTPTPAVNRLPGQPIPAELHDVLAANCPKDLLAVLAGMVDEVGNEPFLENGF